MKHTHQVLRHLGKLSVAIGAAGLLACHEPAYTQTLVVGFIDFDDPAWPLPQIPETATVGVPLDVTVRTGHRGCAEYAFTGSGATGRSASVTPHDYLTLTDGIDCSAGGLEFIEHSATLVFDEPGTAEITLTYSSRGGSNPEDHFADGRKVYTVEVVEAQGLGTRS